MKKLKIPEKFDQRLYESGWDKTITKPSDCDNVEPFDLDFGDYELWMGWIDNNDYKMLFRVKKQKRCKTCGYILEANNED